MATIDGILSRNRSERKEVKEIVWSRTGKDVVKVLENGSSVAVRAESHARSVEFTRRWE